MSRPQSNRLRLGRRSEPGRIYLITATTRNRERYFDDWTVASIAARAVTASDAWPDASLLCWVLMPDHWHALIELRAEPLGVAVGRAKAATMRDVGRALGRPLPLWAPGFHDHALRRDESLRRVARYIVANPVRTGLVDSVGDWPLWDAVWLGEGGCGRDNPIAAEAAPTGGSDRQYASREGAASATTSI